MAYQAEPLLRTDRGEVWLSRLSRPFEFTSPFAGEDFALLLFVATESVSPDEQAELSGAFVAQRCRYAVCAGHDCSTWDESIDWATLGPDLALDPPDERRVITTWHEDETLRDIAWFFLWRTEVDDYVPKHFLALVLGGTAAAREEVTAALREAATAGPPA